MRHTTKRQAPPPKTHPLKRLLVLLVTTALVLGALVLVVYRDRWNLDALARWMAYRDLETSDFGAATPFSHAGGENLSAAYLDDGILFASSTGARYYSPTGELYLEKVQSLEHPILSSSGTTGIIYDAGGQSLFVFRQAQTVFELSLEGNADLLSARINANGWLTVTAQQSGYKGAVTVYNNSFEKVIQINLSSTFVVDAVLSPDCKTVAVITMDQENGSFATQVLFYPVNQTEPSSQIHLGNTVVLDVDFEPNLLWILSESQLITVEVSNGTLHSHSFGPLYVKGCDLSADGFALLLVGPYRAGSASTVQTIDRDASVIGTLSLYHQVLDFSSAGSYCSLLTGTELTIYNKWLEPYAVLEATQGARHTDLRADGCAVLVNHQQAWLYIPN